MLYRESIPNAIQERAKTYASLHLWDSIECRSTSIPIAEIIVDPILAD